MLSKLIRLGRGLLFLLVCSSPAWAGLPVYPVPELSPGSMTSAITLLVGGLLILRDRKRQR
jgi:hypothetical protein